MACKLYFNDGKYDVLTTSWTAASKDGESVDICYTWGADKVSFFNGATGTSRIEFSIPFATFLNHVVECEKTGKIVILSSDSFRRLMKKKPSFPTPSP